VRRRTEGTLVVSLGLWYAVALLPFFAFGRFRLPWIPWLALLGGIGLADAIELVRARRRAAAAVLVALALGAALAQRWIDLRPSSSPIYERLFLLHVADHNGGPAELERAARAVLAALERTEEVPRRMERGLWADGYAALGRARVQRGRLADGLADLRRSQRYEPRPETAGAIAGLERTLGDPAAARATLERAVESFPAEAGLRLQLGRAYLEAGRRDRGEREILAAARIAPDAPAIQFEAASELTARPAAARAALARFLRLRPEEATSPAVLDLRRKLGTGTNS
jgi:tetratricopeptide (TPR) repeat protein